MKKLVAGICLLWLCLSQGTAQGAEDCIKTINQGAATVPLGAFTQQCATISWTAGMITSDVTYNCCGASPTIRVNASDWEQLRKAGKLDGFRYQVITSSDNGYTLTFRKMQGSNPTTIAGEDFFK
ncbi:hypothetical protein DRW03_03300 [Corallococcus sp. H22C18031201]|nr:hypothetical protein DRW03_03300 [Corallococcus sp. H22C18031201]